MSHSYGMQIGGENHGTITRAIRGPNRVASRTTESQLSVLGSKSSLQVHGPIESNRVTSLNCQIIPRIFQMFMLSRVQSSLDQIM